MIPGRNLGRLLEARKMQSEHSAQAESAPRVLIEDVGHQTEKEIVEDGEPHANMESEEMET